MTATAAAPYNRATHRVTFRAAVQELNAIEALANAMGTTTSGVIRAGIARLHADLITDNNA
jgi:hypothetical protein